MLLGDVNIQPYCALKYDLSQVCFFFSDFFSIFSSNNILTDGETVSSYCPERTAQRKAIKKPEATRTPIMISSIITDML